MEINLKDFKWEDSPGLCKRPAFPFNMERVVLTFLKHEDHGCAVCGLCLNSAKAKRTCHGIHSEPCNRYHQTMFHKGKRLTFILVAGISESRLAN